MARCNRKCEVYSRVVGYHRPVQNWNKGKREEFNERVEFNLNKSIKGKIEEIPKEVVTCENPIKDVN